MKGIIAECGNHHFGDVDNAKLMIKMANDHGADYCKFQAIDPNVVANIGSMPKSFYELCELTTDEYSELVEYGKSIGIVVFFSIFGEKHGHLLSRHYTNPFKISGWQFENWEKSRLSVWNEKNSVVSIPKISHDWKLYDRKESISEMNILFVTPYLETEVSFQTIIKYQNLFDKPIGFSDHAPGIANCVTAFREFDCELIETHFNPFGMQEYEGKKYRDCFHAVTAKELEQLAKVMKGHLR